MTEAAESTIARRQGPRIQLTKLPQNKLGEIHYDRREANWVISVDRDADLLTQLEVVQGLAARVFSNKAEHHDGMVFRQDADAVAPTPKAKPRRKTQSKLPTITPEQVNQDQHA